MRLNWLFHLRFNRFNDAVRILEDFLLPPSGIGSPFSEDSCWFLVSCRIIPVKAKDERFEFNAEFFQRSSLSVYLFFFYFFYFFFFLFSFFCYCQRFVCYQRHRLREEWDRWFISGVLLLLLVPMWNRLVHIKETLPAHSKSAVLDRNCFLLCHFPSLIYFCSVQLQLRRRAQLVPGPIYRLNGTRKLVALEKVPFIRSLGFWPGLHFHSWTD